MLGQDAALFDQYSEAVDRTVAYADSFSGIHAYVFAKKISRRESVYKNVSVVGFSTLLQSVLGIIRIYRDTKKIQKSGFEVLITTQDPFEIGLAGLILSRIMRIPLHVQVHTDISSTYMQRENIRTRVQYILSLFVLVRAQRIRVVSRRIEKFCLQKLHIKTEKLDIVPMFYKRGIKRTTAPFSGQPQIIILPARFVWFKRIPVALEAFSFALQRNKNIRLQIIGAGHLKQEIEKAIVKLGLTEHVEIIPWMKAEELYQNVTITLISSVYEGWCRVAVESVEAGVPVVMTDVGCAHEFVTDNKEGLIAPIEDSTALGNAIGKILENKDFYMQCKSSCVQASDSIDSFSTYQSKVVKSWIATISQIG